MAASFVSLIRNRQSVPMAVHNRASLKIRTPILDAHNLISESSSSSSDSEKASSSGGESESYFKDPLVDKLNEIPESKLKLIRKKIEHVEELRKQLFAYDLLACIVGTTGLILSHVENEDYYDSSDSHDKNKSGDYNNSMRLIVSISTIALLGIIIRRSVIDFNIKRERLIGPEALGRWFTCSFQFYRMILECLICAVHWPPYIDKQFEFKQLNGSLILSANAVCSAFMLLRTYLILRLLVYSIGLKNRRTEAILDAYGCKSASAFSLKIIIKENSTYFLLITVLSILVFATALRIFERPYNEGNDIDQNFKHIWNSMWLICLAMTTVGYGDIAPKTHMGRFITTLSCFWGVFLISVSVVLLTNVLTFSDGEEKSFYILSQLNVKDKTRILAGNVVKNCLCLNVVKKSHSPDSEIVRKRKALLKRSLDNFNEYLKRDESSTDNLEGLLQELLDRLTIEMNRISEYIGEAKHLDSTIKDLISQQRRASQVVKNAIIRNSVSYNQSILVRHGLLPVDN